MNRKTGEKMAVDSYKIYSLDRCFKCLSVLNLGQKAYCTVLLKGRSDAAGREPANETDFLDDE